MKRFYAIIFLAALSLAGCAKDKKKEVPQYAVIVTTDGHGTATADKVKTEAGVTVTLTATPVSGYKLLQWKVESGELILLSTTTPTVTFIMPAADVSIMAEFTVVVPTYAITLTNNGKGTAKATVGEADAERAEVGATVTLTATPGIGYAFSQWVVTGGGVILSNTLVSPTTFIMLAKDVSVKAEFVKGVMINGIIWSEYNVDVPGSFTGKPEDYGMYYQWNRKTGWSTTDPMISSPAGVTWNSTDPGGAEGDVWESVNDPCPEGWRVPTVYEQHSLFHDNVLTGWTILNGVQGRQFADKTSGVSIFFPAAGRRYSDGELGSFSDRQDNLGIYWSGSSTEYGAQPLVFYSDSPGGVGNVERSHGLSVRCVRK